MGSVLDRNTFHRTIHKLHVIRIRHTLITWPCKGKWSKKSWISDSLPQVSGSIVAPDSKWAWIGHHINTWLAFSYVNGLIFSGKGQIDGQGSAWWPNPCLQNVQTVRIHTHMSLYIYQFTDHWFPSFKCTKVKSALLSHFYVFRVPNAVDQV